MAKNQDQIEYESYQQDLNQYKGGYTRGRGAKRARGYGYRNSRTEQEYDPYYNPYAGGDQYQQDYYQGYYQDYYQEYPQEYAQGYDPQLIQEESKKLEKVKTTKEVANKVDQPQDVKTEKPKVKKPKPKKVIPEPEPVKISKKKRQFFISPYTEEIESDTDHDEKLEVQKHTPDPIEDKFEKDAELINDNGYKHSKKNPNSYPKQEYQRNNYITQNSDDIIKKVKSTQENSLKQSKVS